MIARLDRVRGGRGMLFVRVPSCAAPAGRGLARLPIAEVLVVLCVGYVFLLVLRAALGSR